jgi:putative Mn2+ efflux pump MntP
MIKEAFSNEDENINDLVDFKTMSILAIATSIDALAVGITFAFLQVNIASAVSIIGIITFVISIIGVKLGNVFGTKYEKNAEIIGGSILILMGLKILIEHLLG